LNQQQEAVRKFIFVVSMYIFLWRRTLFCLRVVNWLCVTLQLNKAAAQGTTYFICS